MRVFVDGEHRLGEKHGGRDAARGGDPGPRRRPDIEEVTAPGGRAYDAVVQAFGRGSFWTTNRSTGSAWGRSSSPIPRRANDWKGITHPAILEAMKEAIAGIEREGHRAAVVEATLIHESGRKGLSGGGDLGHVRPGNGDFPTRRPRRDVAHPSREARLRAQMDADRKAGAPIT